MASALQIFRTGTASLSARAFRSTVATRLTPFNRRRYSENASDKAPGEEQETDSSLSSTPEQVKVAEKLRERDAEVVDLTSRLRYLQADFLNLQRNAAREKEQTRDFAITRFATDLLETADVLTLALKSVPPSLVVPVDPPSASAQDTSEKTPQQRLQELYQGVEITQRQLLQTLFKYHVKPFDPTGDRFDPNFHEALYQAPIPGKEPGTVIDCQKIGYTIKDRVLRAAQVGVAQDIS